MKVLKVDEAQMDAAIAALVGKIFSEKQEIDGVSVIRQDTLSEAASAVVGLTWPEYRNGGKSIRNKMVELGLARGGIAENDRGFGRGHLTYHFTDALEAAPMLLGYGLYQCEATRNLRKALERRYGKNPVKTAEVVTSVTQNAAVKAEAEKVAAPVVVAKALEPELSNVVQMKRSIRSQITERWPICQPYVDELVKKAAKVLGDRVVMNGNAKCCTDEDFNGLVVPSLIDPLIHYAARDAQAHIIANTKAKNSGTIQSVEFNPKGFPIVTRDNLVFYPDESSLMVSASLIAQQREEYELTIASLYEEVASLRQSLTHAWNSKVA